MIRVVQRGGSIMRTISSALAAVALLAMLVGCDRRPPAPDIKANPAGAAPEQNIQANSQAQAQTARPDSAAPESEVDQGYGTEAPEGTGNLDFIVVNRTGRTITGISISPAGDESWSDDILVQRELMENERGAVSYTRDVEQCFWDVRATFQDGGNRSWPRRNLCNTIRVELR